MDYNTTSTEDCPPDLYGMVVARRWLKTCQTKHPICSTAFILTDGGCEESDVSSNPALLLPRRLLDVGPHGSEDVKLINTDTGADKEYRYLALSHCWGDASKVRKTTLSNLLQHCEGIQCSTLSKTFQDAILVTQLLGFRFLWIDSLCIIQDSREDFELECARMHTIYLNCDCMLSASDARSGDEGFLTYWERGNTGQAEGTTAPPKPRPALDPESACTVRIRQGISWRQWSTLLAGPLSTRGWTFQERQLAPRILHYTRHGMMWECRSCIGAGDSTVLQYRRTSHKLDDYRTISHKLDDYRKTSHKLDEQPNPSTPRMHYVPYAKLPDLFRILDGSPAQVGEDIMAQWLSLVDDYSRRNLTFIKDKLPAISTLAAIVSYISPEPSAYLAGVWASDLARQLYWQPKPRSSQGRTAHAAKVFDRFPSWSWTSYNGPITYAVAEFFFTDYMYHRTEKYEPHAVFRFLSSDVRPQGHDHFGDIEGRQLDVYGEFVDDANPTFKTSNYSKHPVRSDLRVNFDDGETH
ncbi:HET-domain-containing protein [Trematosphaeria pertusa]|uniref:HET-domain-containing protein n=1 Tax=Trematosphaeria pertusa TaxID=390896 RepID=A0A6A6I762_9PLEO|nr:HET-domain-containing protein [Trematosphaeria pertusa]KAF2246394.1 HET-domain-containing protein [Trematosphaeria pertusa]